MKLSTFIPLKIRKRGIRKVIVRPEVGGEGALPSNRNSSGSEIAKLEGLHHSSVNELLRLTLLEPATIQRILAGQQPRCMSLLWFQRNPPPVDWALQRKLVEGFDA